MNSTEHDGATTITSLKDTIAAFYAEMSKHAPPDVLAVAAAELQKIANTGIAAGAVRVGARAPDFSLPDAQGNAVTLAGLLAQGPVVVSFYRGGWCPFCDLQLRAYQGVLEQIHDLGAELV